MKTDKGGGFAVLTISIAFIFLLLIIMSLIADYSLYSLKRNSISHAIDYSVSAAVQEIDEDASKKGFENETTLTGNATTDNIVFNDQKALDVFFSMFKENCGIDKELIQNYLLSVIIEPTENNLNYVIRKGTLTISEGTVSDPSQLELVINTAIRSNYNSPDAERDLHEIFVNGNKKTNTFLKRPYFLVFVKDFEIDGLFKKRTSTFVGLAAAKIERKN